MLQKLRNAASPSHHVASGGMNDSTSHYNGGNSGNFYASPRQTALTPLNQSVMSQGDGHLPPTTMDRQDVESRQSQVCRQVIEEYA